MDIQADIPSLLLELDNQRVARGLSYQAVEDTSGISKSTVCRILKGQSDVTIQQLQAIAAAVQYKPTEKEIVPQSFTQEGYITYLQDTLQRQKEESDRHVRQLQAHYNMLRRQDRRTIMVMGAILGILVVFICVLFLYDFAHLDRGWIQAYANSITSSIFGQTFLSVRDWFGGFLWNV